MANLYKISLIFAFIVLAACTDYGDVVDEKYEELIASQQVVDTLACDLKSEGMEIPTADGGKRKCVGGEWIPIVEEYVSSSSENEHSSSSIVKSSSSVKASTEKPISSSVVSSSSSVPESSCSSSILESSSDEVPESSSSIVTELYLCDDGIYVVTEESCTKVESSSSSSPIPSSSSITPVLSSSSQSSSSSGYRDESVYDRINHLLTDKRDGKTYKTTTIDGIVWMAENLNYDYNHGSARSFCYGDLESNCDTYGRLYDWAAAIDSAGIFSSVTKECGNGVKCNENGSKIYRGTCPKGWHVPTNDDQILLYTSAKTNKYVNAQDALKSIELWNPKGQDLRGFSALPSGYRNMNGVYEGLGKETYLWALGTGVFTYYEPSSTNAWTISLSEVDQFNTPLETSNAVSLRCVMDIVSEQGSFIDSRDGREYKTVTIGDQTWMAENLAYNETGNCPKNDAALCELYGRLYTLTEASTSCPEGWKLPSKEEWQSLINAVGVYPTDANKALVSKNGWNQDYAGTDSYGFSILPVGCNQSDYQLNKCTGNALFWTTSMDESSPSYSRTWWIMSFNYKDERNPLHIYSWSQLGIGTNSVRCLKE